MLFNAMSIRIKAAFGLVLLTLFILAIGGINYFALDRLQGNTQLFAGTLMPGQGVVINADRDLYQALTAQQDFLLAQGKGDKAAGYKQDFAENVQQAKERMEKFLTLMADYPEVTGQLQQFPELFSSWQAGAEQVFTLAEQGNLEDATRLHHDLGDKFSTLREQYNLAGELDEKLAETLHQASDEMADSTQFWTLALLVFSLVIGMLLIYFGPKLIVDAILAVYE